MVAPHDEHLDEGSGEVSIKGSVLPLVPKEAYLHEEDIPTRATPSIINKGQVCHHDTPFQILECSEESFDELRMTDSVKTPLEDYFL